MPEIDRTLSIADYEALINPFKPTEGTAATNTNDLRQFVYDWFTHFEHAGPVAYYLDHLAKVNLQVVLPGARPLASHLEFATWYNNLLAQTLWNFHDLGRIESNAYWRTNI